MLLVLAGIVALFVMTKNGERKSKTEADDELRVATQRAVEVGAPVPPSVVGRAAAAADDAEKKFTAVRTGGWGPTMSMVPKPWMGTSVQNVPLERKPGPIFLSRIDGKPWLWA